MGGLPFGNIMAPPWMGLTPVVAGVTDTEYDLIPLNAVVVPASTPIPDSGFSMGNLLPIDADDFLVRELQWFVEQTGTLNAQDLRVRIRDAAGRLFTSDFVQIIDLTGPLVPAWPLCKSTQLIFDFQNVNTTTPASVTVCLKGWRRRPCPGQVAVPSNYVPMSKRYTVPTDPSIDVEDFGYPYTFTMTGAGDLLKVPLQTDQDASFLWRAIAGDWNTANNDVATVGSVGVTFYDVAQRPLNVYQLINPWNSGNCGLFRELVFSNGGGLPAPIYPEIEIPPGGVVLVDLSFGGPGTLRFCLRGKKVYTQCR